MRALLLALFVAGCGASGEVLEANQQDAAPPAVDLIGVVNLGGPHPRCAVAGESTAHVRTQDCAGLVPELVPATCPGTGASPVVTCVDAPSGVLVTFDCGTGCVATYAAQFR